MQSRIYLIQQEQKKQHPSQATIAKKPDVVVVNDLSAIRAEIPEMFEIEEV